MPLTPQQIQLLIDSGDISASNARKLPLAEQAIIAKMKPMLLVPDPVEAVTPAVMVGAGGEALSMLKGAGSVASSIPGAAKSVWNTVAPYAGGAAGAEIGQRLGHPWIGAMLGHSLGGKAQIENGPAPPTAKPWGQRPAPIAGSKTYGPSNSAPSRGPMQGPASGPPSRPQGMTFPPGMGEGMPQAPKPSQSLPVARRMLRDAYATQNEGIGVEDQNRIMSGQAPAVNPRQGMSVEQLIAELKKVMSR